MNKKEGFTLIELLAVITILAIIAVIATPMVLNSVQNSRENTYIQQTHTLEKTAERWSIKHAGELKEDQKNYLDIDTLVVDGYLESEDVIDPRDNSRMNGCIVIEFDKENNQFDFTYNENTCATLQK